MGKPSTIVHNFANDERDSHRYNEFWENIYRRRYPDVVNILENTYSTKLQAVGVDRLIFLKNGRVVLLDEKNRPNRHEIRDLLIEYAHEKEDGSLVPGWIEKPLKPHYIAYGFQHQSLRCAVFVPFIALQRAWVYNKKEWLSLYGKKLAKNFSNGKAYTTLSCPVPIEVLKKFVPIEFVSENDHTTA